MSIINQTKKNTNNNLIILYVTSLINLIKFNKEENIITQNEPTGSVLFFGSYLTGRRMNCTSFGLVSGAILARIFICFFFFLIQILPAN